MAMAAAANIADADALLIDSDYVPTPTATISRQPTEHGHGSELQNGSGKKLLALAMIL